MYCIGICDDGVNVCSFIEKCLLEQAEKERLQIDIDIWNNRGRFAEISAGRKPYRYSFFGY